MNGLSRYRRIKLLLLPLLLPPLLPLLLPLLPLLPLLLPLLPLLPLLVWCLYGGMGGKAVTSCGHTTAGRNP